MSHVVPLVQTAPRATLECDRVSPGLTVAVVGARLRVVLLLRQLLQTRHLCRETFYTTLENNNTIQSVNETISQSQLPTINFFGPVCFGPEPFAPSVLARIHSALCISANRPST